MNELKSLLPVLLTAAALTFVIDVTGFPGEESEKFLLGSYAGLAELFYGVRHYHVPGVGYAEAGGYYVIGRECLGVNFTAMLFAVCAVSFAKRFRGAGKALWVAVCLPFAAATGYAANAVRILGSVPFAGSARFGLIHAALGIALYLFLLTAVYTALKVHFRKDPKS